MTALDRKLGRELWRLKGQMLSIALVVAAGVMSVISMRGSYESLLAAQESYYRSTRFADVWASLERAPEAVRRDIEQIPGVTAVDTRVTFLATLDLPDLDVPGLGRFVSIPVPDRPGLNDIHLTAGRYPVPGARDEVLASQTFAEANGLEPGASTVAAVLNGRARTLDIVGWAIAPEHSYSVPPGSLYPEDERYGVFWMARDTLGPAYDMDRAFNDLAVTLGPGVDPAAVIARLDRLLEPYGGLGAYPRDDQPSHQILAGELDQNRVTGSVIPAIFLAVAAFLLHLVLGRLIATQRSEIAVLKAFGYRNREVGGHYLRFALAAVVVGAVLGTALGTWLGGVYIGIYGDYFQFPELVYHLSWRLVAIACGVSVLAAMAGAWGAVRKAVDLPPAEAMRPEPPATFRAGWVERAGVGRLLPPAARMVLRHLERHPARSFFAALGVAYSVAVLVIGMFLFDGLDQVMDLQFRVAQREDLMVTFSRPMATSVRHELAAIDGVGRVETFRAVPARLRAGHRQEEVAIQAVEPGAHLRRLVTVSGRVQPVPAAGMVLGERLAAKLRVAPGDAVAVEVLEGARRTATVPVVGVIEDFFGLTATMDREALRRLAGGVDLASGAHLVVAADARTAASSRLARLPAVAGVVSPRSTLDAFEAQLADSLYIGIAFLLGFAGVIAVAVVYNGARVALSERGRELASLRVMGLRRGEVARLLLGEQAAITLLAIPLGWAIGWALAWAVVTSVATDAYRIPLAVSLRTYLLSAAFTVLAAVASGALVRHRIDHLDLIEVLKTRE